MTDLHGDGRAGAAADALVSASEEVEHEDVVVEAVAPEFIAFADEGKPLSQWLLFRRRFFRHKLAVASLIVLVVIALMVICAPLVTKYDPVAQDLKNIRKPPNGTHWWGTDNLGRDVYSRVIYAGRISLKIGFSIAIISTLVGTVVGSVAGYVG